MKNSGTKNTYFLILFINLAFFLNAQNFAGDKYFKKRLYLKAKESYLNELELPKRNSYYRNTKNP
jgi:hypothetical protein